MNMRTGLWAIGLLMCGLGMLALAAWQYFGPEEGPRLIVDEPEREVSHCSVGQTKALTFSFHNRAHHSVQVIGLAPC